MEKAVQGNSDWIEVYGLDPTLLTEFKIKCDKDCGEEARYWITTTCCNSAVFWCKEDCEIEYKFILRAGHQESYITCDHCNKRVPAKGSLSKPHKF